MSVDIIAGGVPATRRIAERRFFLFMAVLLLVTAVVGFAPNSTAILAGTRETPPLLVHLHAALMLAWLLLLVTQTKLNHSGRTDLHRRLGQTAFVLVPLMVLVMILVSGARFITDERRISRLPRARNCRCSRGRNGG